MKNRILVLLIVVSTIFSFSFLSADDSQISAGTKIANYLKSTVEHVTPAEMDEMMIAHFQQIRLMDETGAWVAPELTAHGDFLIPGDIDTEKNNEFIDHMLRAAEDNEYLKDFLEKAQHEDFSDYMAQVEEHGAVVFPDVIAYAHALERLNIVMREDWTILELCKEIWQQAREDENLKKYMELFELAKLYSVEIPMLKIIKAQKDAYIPPTFLKGLLPTNVMEATMVDMLDGMKGNGYAGIVLASYPPGKREEDPLTGEGPSCFSDDGKAILLKMALPRKWADLYATWNLAFVTSYEHPYIMAKLLIPSVNDYKDEPAEYIYNRGLALYTHIHWELLRRVDYMKANKEVMLWPDDHLRKFWGDANKEYAKQYEDDVAEVKNSFWYWFRSLWRK